jgi:large conductance mechanosensitive channel
VIKEFREFIDRGNFLDIAVGFAMGAAFTAIVSAFTDRIVNPAIGLVFDLDSLDSLGTFGENGSVGAFVGAIVNFLVVGLFLFLVVRMYNRYRRAGEEETASAPAEEVILLTEIRDELRARSAD